MFNTDYMCSLIGDTLFDAASNSDVDFPDDKEARLKDFIEKVDCTEDFAKKVFEWYDNEAVSDGRTINAISELYEDESHKLWTQKQVKEAFEEAGIK